MGFLANKRALIAGVASNRSIAWGIAEAMKREGAEVALSYQGERLKERVEGLAQEIGSSIAIQCDVSQDQDIQQLFMKLSKHWDHFDILVHSIGYAPADQIKGDFLDNISREGFHIAHDISTYSFPAMAKAAKPMMEGRNFALLTLSYLGADRALPNYNTMGLAKASLEAATRYMAQSLGKHGGRVNAISAGPIKTLAASGVSDFRKMLETVGNTAPIGRNITQEDVGNVAAFLCSDLAAGVTGEVVFVDGGYNIIGMHF